MKIHSIVMLAILAGVTLSHVHGAQDHHHKCVHDTKFKDVVPIVLEDQVADPSDRILVAGPNWHNIRIKIDYKYGDEFVKKDPSVKAKYALSIKLIESVKKYFQSALQVYFNQNFRFTGGKCYQKDIAAFQEEIDLYIVLSPENDPKTSYFAAATACYLSQVDKRPTIGAYILNFSFLKTDRIYEYLYFSTFAHEFTHILGFSDNLFERFVKEGRPIPKDKVVRQIRIGNESFNAIVMPEVVNYARQYFNCPNIEGVPLENNGGEGSAGSHWEKLFLPSEYMNPTVENPGIISAFTMAFLKGTGWYLPLVGQYQPYDWGQGAGCRHFEICPKGSHGYCTAEEANSAICSTEYHAKAVCKKDSDFSSGCYVKKALEHSCMMEGGQELPKVTNEYYGAGSRCFNFKAQQSGKTYRSSKCLNTRCRQGQVDLKVGTKIYTCTKNYELITIPGEQYRLECPNIDDFCDEQNKKCPNDCMANGICLLGNKCSCFSQFVGEDCSQLDNNSSVFTASKLFKISGSTTTSSTSFDGTQSSASTGQSATSGSSIFTSAICLILLALAY